MAHSDHDREQTEVGVRNIMRVTTAGGKKGFDPSKVIVSGKTMQPDELAKATDNSPGKDESTKSEPPALPEAATHRLCRTSKQRDAYDEVYDTLEHLKPRRLQKKSEAASNTNVITAPAVNVPARMTISTPASEQEQGDGYLEFHERAQSKKHSKKEIFLTICGLWLIIFVLVKVFRWFAA